MTSSIPDSFNIDDLEQLLEDAPLDIVDRPVEKQEYESREEEISAIADKALIWATEQVDDPLVHKVMMMNIAARMVEWHTNIGVKMIDDGEEQSGVC